MDVFEYFLQKEREFAELGLSPAPTSRSETMFAAEEGTDDRRGFVWVKLALDDDAYIQVYEHVAVENDHVTRLTYAYALIVDGASVEQWHRDPENHPESPVHEHTGPERTRVPDTEPVTLKEVVERAWAEISLRAEAPPD